MRYDKTWGKKAPDIQPQSERDVLIYRCEIGMKIILSEGEVCLRIMAIIHYAQNLTPLNRTAVIDLAQKMIYCTQCTEQERLQLHRGWMNGFLKRNISLKVVSLQII